LGEICPDAHVAGLTSGSFPPARSRVGCPAYTEVAVSTTADSTTSSDIRPWGRYHVLHEGDDVKVKIIEVTAGQRLSYQVHQHRAEHWFVTRGSGTVVLDGEETPVSAGSTVDVPVGTAHRICAGDDGVTFVEVQTGTYFGEDDIVRLSDDYGR
jgi:mannose-6-phosphate isomerase